MSSSIKNTSTKRLADDSFFEAKVLHNFRITVLMHHDKKASGMQKQSWETI